MELSPDAIIYAQWGPVKVNATLIFTWVTMVLLVGGSWLVTRRLSVTPHESTQQTAIEAVVAFIQQQIEETMQRSARPFLPFIGTLFLFIAVSNLLSAVPGYRAPTGSLSTTAALAMCVFIAVPLYGVTYQGLAGYARHYIEPSVIMLPFNIIGELSRTLAMAVRLFGNVMSGEMVVAVLLLIVPLFVPVVMQLLGLLIGVIQAYIFAVLATVYIASAIEGEAELRQD